LAPRSLGDYMADVRSYFPHIQDGECQALVWKAILLIHGEESLPFMVAEPAARIVTAASYSTGTITITGGVTVALTDGVWDPAWTGRKIIIGGRSERYAITITGAAAGTLSETFLGSDTTDLTYTIFKDIYELPSDCEIAKEIVVFDVNRKRELDLVDYEALVFERESNSARPGQPLRAARVGITSTGTSQLIFDPPPSSVMPFLVPYYRSPTKPANLTAPLNPPWPEAFHDVIAMRAVAEYADRKGHPRRLEFRNRYRVRMRRLRSSVDGGSELRRRLRDRWLENNSGVLTPFVSMREG
jgi:hypothetical protein